MRIRISRHALAAIYAHSASQPDREVCGLLLGSVERIETATPAENVAPDPRAHFEIDPAALFAAIRMERRGGASLSGYYHSHPRGVAAPSETDRQCAAPDGKTWLIVAGDIITAWKSLPGGFERVELDPV